MTSISQFSDNVYRNLYNDHIEYKEIRNEENRTYTKYVHDVKFWKLKYIEKLLHHSGCIDEIQVIGEIGCATGVLLANFMKSKTLEKVGIDISDENIAYARKKYPTIHFFRGSFDEFQTDNLEPFDLIILSDILEHVEQDVDLLKKAGCTSKYVVVNLPIEKVPEYKDRAYGINDVEGHLRAYSLEDAFEMCVKADMEVMAFYAKRYVKQATFRKYLFEKLLTKYPDKLDALVQYQKELIEIDLAPEFYKQNFFALLKRKNDKSVDG